MSTQGCIIGRQGCIMSAQGCIIACRVVSQKQTRVLSQQQTYVLAQQKTVGPLLADLRSTFGRPRDDFWQFFY